MIVSKILGGLGNQLFQYAAARTLALQHNQEVKLELSGLAGDGLRQFQLDAFCTKQTTASESEISALRPHGRIERILQRLKPPGKKRFYKEPHFHFDPSFFSLTPPVYLQGYFQSEKYFAPAASILRRELVFRETFSPAVEAFAKKLRSENAVSLHVRRGGYTNAEANKVHGILPAEYYKAAAALAEQAVKVSAKFYLFSDEPNHSLKDLRGLDVEVVSGRLTKSALEDFYLLQHCRCNVIANSSFSWWAAWLNKHADKIVIAPKKWFNQGPADTQDLLPSDWIRL